MDKTKAKLKVSLENITNACCRTGFTLCSKPAANAGVKSIKMTTLVAIHLGEIVIIAADKKEVFIQGDFVIPIHESANKIIDSGIGLMTGSGYVSLLQEVKDKVSNCTIKNTDQILSLISAARKKVQDSDVLDEAQKQQVLGKTGWLFTYRTTFNGKVALRVALYHPSISTTNLSIIDENQTKIIFPSDIAEDKVAQYAEILASRFTAIGKGELEETLSKSVDLILQIVKELSNASQTVSATVDIGLVASSGEQYIAKSVTVDSRGLEFVPFGS